MLQGRLPPGQRGRLPSGLAEEAFHQLATATLRGFANVIRIEHRKQPVSPLRSEFPASLGLQRVDRHLRKGGYLRQAGKNFVRPHDKQTFCGQRVKDMTGVS